MAEIEQHRSVPLPLSPHCVASARYSSLERTTNLERGKHAGLFRSALLSADGTAIVTSSEDHALRTFVLPPGLLNSPHALILEPYTTHQHPEPISAHTLYPHFTLSDPTTTLALSSTRDHPIRLSNVLVPSAATIHPDTGAGTNVQNPILATYPLVHALTETYLTPTALLFTTSGTHFLAGTLSALHLFDISRHGSGPTETHATIPSRRKKLVGGGVGFKGIVSALAINGDGVLAAGSFGGGVGLYDNEGSGGCVGVFSVRGEGKDGNGGVDGGGYAGAGITSLHWSPCSRYLYVAERVSDGILMYDVRVTGRRLGILTGRKAMTQQRLGMDVVPCGADGRGGHEVWAGGMDGVVRVWRDPHLRGADEGGMEGVSAPDGEMGFGPTEMWRAHDGVLLSLLTLSGRPANVRTDAISSTLVHGSGSVAATCSGSRPPAGVEYEGTSGTLDVADSESNSGSDSASSMSGESDREDAVDMVSGRSSSVENVGNAGGRRIGDEADYSLKIWSLV